MYVYTHITTLFSLTPSHLTLQTAVNPHKLKFRLKPMESHLVNISPKLLNTKYLREQLKEKPFKWLFQHLTQDFTHGAPELHCCHLLHFASASASVPASLQSSPACDGAGKAAQRNSGAQNVILHCHHSNSYFY